MKDIMFEIPSREEVEKVIVTEESVKDKKPQFVIAESGKRAPLKLDSKSKAKRGSEPA